MLMIKSTAVFKKKAEFVVDANFCEVGFAQVIAWYRSEAEFSRFLTAVNYKYY